MIVTRSWSLAGMPSEVHPIGKRSPENLAESPGDDREHKLADQNGLNPETYSCTRLPSTAATGKFTGLPGLGNGVENNQLLGFHPADNFPGDVHDLGGSEKGSLSRGAVAVTHGQPAARPVPQLP